MNSAIYEGTIRHRRHVPSPHAFGYRMFQIYLDLDEVETLFAPRWLWSTSRRNIAEFRRSDFHGSPDVPLLQAVRATVAERSGMTTQGPVRLLTHLRYFGASFNPVSFYFGFHPDGTTLEWVMAEITNTPWRERHAYVLPVAEATCCNGFLEWDFDKQFHVSPFLPLDRRYRWRLQVPGSRLAIHMQVDAGATREFDATLGLRRRPITSAALARVLLRFPAMTVQVLAAIHWQALRLWLKGTPVHDHPSATHE